jgi:LacI family transcriptional regulator
MKSKKYADIIDVANQAGVSPATVSRCFNHPDKVRADTRKRIQMAVETTGYIRNRAAQAIHGRRSGTVGLIVPTLDNAIFSNLIQAFSEQLNANGFTMLVATHGYDLDREYQLLRSLLEHRVEGIGLIGLDHKEETYSLIERRETPSVAMWNYRPDTRISCVGADNYQAGRTIARHILDIGHKQIALVFPDIEGNDRAAHRLKGVQDVLKEQRIAVPRNWHLHTTYSIKHARSVCTPLLSSDDKPTAIIAGNDVIAQGVVYAAQALGLTVPDHISVAGIGDFSGSAHLLPSLTTIRLRSNKVGQTAGLILDRLINGEDKNRVERVAISAELMQRESTAQPLKRHAA